jgi:hypothetical protein
LFWLEGDEKASLDSGGGGEGVGGGDDGHDGHVESDDVKAELPCRASRQPTRSEANGAIGNCLGTGWNTHMRGTGGERRTHLRSYSTV